MIDVHQRAAVHAAEVRVLQALLNGAQGLGREVKLLRSEDPYQVAFGLEREDLGSIQQDLPGAVAPDDLAEPGGGGLENRFLHARELIGDVGGMAHQTPGAGHRFG